MPIWPWLIGGAVTVKLLPEQCSAANAVADWKGAAFAAQRLVQALSSGKVKADTTLFQQAHQLTTWAQNMATLYRNQEAVAANPLMAGVNMDACKLKEAAAKYYTEAVKLLLKYRDETGDTRFDPPPKPQGMQDEEWSWKDVAFWGAVVAGGAYVVRGLVSRNEYKDPPRYARR